MTNQLNHLKNLTFRVGMKAPAPLKVAMIVKSKVGLETVKDGCQINRLKGTVFMQCFVVLKTISMFSVVELHDTVVSLTKLNTVHTFCGTACRGRVEATM